MAPQTEVSPVLANIQKKTVRTTVRLVAGKTFTILYRRVHHLLLPKSIVALRAKHGNLGHQFETL
jgi:hypothetical protein